MDTLKPPGQSTERKKQSRRLKHTINTVLIFQYDYLFVERVQAEPRALHTHTVILHSSIVCMIFSLPTRPAHICIYVYILNMINKYFNMFDTDKLMCMGTVGVDFSACYFNSMKRIINNGIELSIRILSIRYVYLQYNICLSPLFISYIEVV